jgi:CRISPR-associated endonuclease Cas2
MLSASQRNLPPVATYLIAYDICKAKRLRRVARYLEKYATRVQKSVFILMAHKSEMLRVMDEAASLINPDVDKIQAWRVHQQTGSENLAQGPVIPVQPTVVIATRGRFRWLSRRNVNGKST